MEKRIKANKILVEETERTMSLGRSSRRMKDKVKRGHKAMEVSM
jgi:hypothetical protein